MEKWNEIRHRVLADGASKRSVRRDYGIGAAVLDKILALPEPPGYRQRVERPKSKLGPFMGVVDAILEDDKQAPPKQRHTARRIFDRLSDEHGYSGSEVTVRRYVALHKRTSAEVFVPLSQPPGEAQFDFGEATVEIEGIRVKAALAVMTLPYSDAFFVSAYPRECTETFQAGHVARVLVLRGRSDQDRLRQHLDRGRKDHRTDRTGAHEGVPPTRESRPDAPTASVASLGATRRVTSRTSSATDGGTSSHPCLPLKRSAS